MTAPKFLVDAIRNASAIWIKTDGYVPAHITANEGKTIGDEWTEDRMIDYLYGEAMLNHKDGEFPPFVSIFVGEAKYHAFVVHYHVRKVSCDSTWTYEWTRVF